MILPDVNVLIYAFRTDAIDHELCRSWLERTIGDDTPFGMSPLALSALVRVTTGFQSLNNPSSSAEAFQFCEFILDQPNCTRVEPGDRHWRIFRQLIAETATRGRRVTDAWYAALAIEWGCEWITMDRDFARFPGLKWSPPTA